jgi:hypothetical protein
VGHINEYETTAQGDQELIPYHRLDFAGIKVQNGDIEGAARLLNHIRGLNYNLFSLTYLPLIQTHLASKNFEEGDKLISMMRSDLRYLRSSQAYAVIISYCFAKGDIEEGKKNVAALLKSCRASGKAPNGFAVSMIIRSMAETCTKEEILTFWAAVKALDGLPNLAGHSAMIFAMCKFRDKRAASVIVKEAVSRLH